MGCQQGMGRLRKCYHDADFKGRLVSAPGLERAYTDFSVFCCDAVWRTCEEDDSASLRRSVQGSNLLVEASLSEWPKVAHAVSRGSSPSKNRNGLHPYASVHEKAANISGPESHPEKNSDDAWAWCPRISLLYTATLTGHFQFGPEQRLFIVAPCI